MSGNVKLRVSLYQYAACTLIWLFRDEYISLHGCIFSALVIGTDKQPPPTEPPTITTLKNAQGCVCKESEKAKMTDTDAVRQQKIAFEDALQNSFFVRRWDNDFKLKQINEWMNW